MQSQCRNRLARRTGCPKGFVRKVLHPYNPKFLVMKARIAFLLLGYALLTAACVSPTAAGMPLDASSPAVTQPSTPVPTATPVSTATDEPTATAEPTATEMATATATPEAVEADAAETIDTARLELGKEVYRQQACGVCHLLASVETLGTFGPPHDDLATIAAERIHEERYKGTATTAEEYIRESIVNPQAFFVEGYQITRFPMPVFSNLSEQQVDALVYLLMQPPAVVP